MYSVGEFSTNLIAGIVALLPAIVLLGLFAARQLKLEHPVLNVRPGERSFLACVFACGGVDDDDVLDERFVAALF